MQKRFGWLVIAALLFAIVSPLYSREARYLSFSAKNRKGIFVRDLRAEEVELYLDGRAVDIRFFGQRNVETAFAVFLENSPRTAEYTVSQPQWGQVNIVDKFRYLLMDNFFRPMTDLGPGLLAQFYTELEILQPFTVEYDLLEGAVQRMRPDPKGIVFNNIEVGRALGRGVDLLRNHRAKRKILILFTTTVDRESYANFEEYKGMLRNADIELYVISHAPLFVSGPSVPFEVKNNVYFFRNLADETSGAAYFTGEYAYLDELLTQLKGRLTNNYTVGFYVEEATPATEHSVELRLRRKKSKLTYRKILIY